MRWLHSRVLPYREALDVSLLSRFRAVLLELLDHAIEIGITRAETTRQPVSTALGNLLAVSDYRELAGPTRRERRFNAEALLDEGHETRDLGLVVLSRRAVNDLDFHFLFCKSCRAYGTRKHCITSSTQGWRPELPTCVPSGLIRARKGRGGRSRGSAKRGDVTTAPQDPRRAYGTRDNL
jgi:hypothetical protein